PKLISEKKVNNFLKRLENKIAKLKTRKKIETKIKAFEDIMKFLSKEDKVLISLYGGTIRQSLIPLIYGIYYLQGKNFEEFIDIYIKKSIGVFKNDLKNIKKYFNLKIT
ncbi:MAG: hypothetical protein D6834_02960, partial [Aquificota bacterium]